VLLPHGQTGNNLASVKRWQCLACLLVRFGLIG
jgi:hypothetical protein